jgi:hypothetical protein
VFTQAPDERTIRCNEWRDMYSLINECNDEHEEGTNARIKASEPFTRHPVATMTSILRDRRRTLLIEACDPLHLFHWPPELRIAFWDELMGSDDEDDDIDDFEDAT